jgi:surface polysaccharide O-acyltransferase-like enzyme
MLPWITWTVIYFLISYLQQPVSGFSQIINLLSVTFTSFWFLPMILALYIITPALRILVANTKPKEIAFLIILWFLAISVFPFYKNSMAFPLFVDNGLVRQTFSYLGFYLSGFLLTQINLPSKKYIFLFIILGMATSIISYYFRVLNNLQVPHLAFNYIAPGVILTSISLFALIKLFENQLQTVNIRAKSIITSLSQAALGTYFVHGLVSQYFEKIFGFTYKVQVPFANAWINAIILFTMSYLIIWGLIKIPRMKKFIS